jgi:simple sugar transport system ATP-binding protein/ribose transport system ATP-binding protein
MAMLPEDRRGQGLVATMSVRENISLPSIGRYTTWGLVSRRNETDAVVRLLRDLSVVPQRPDADIRTLSGGNQQKVLLGRWLGVAPKLLLLDEPTRGIDVGAKQQIYETIVELAARGLGIVLVSSELEEVMGLSHRVYLIRGGQTLGVVDPRETTLDEVLFRLFGLATDTRVA